MTEIVPRKNGLSKREALQTIVGALSERLEGLTAVLTTLGIQFSSTSMLASGLLLSLALKFADSIRLEELEDTLSQIQRALGSSRTVEWNERNVRALFMHMEVFMQEDFEVKRAILRGVIERFVKDGMKHFSDDEKAFFIKITKDFTPSDIEYLTWAVEKGQFEYPPLEEKGRTLRRIGGLAEKNNDRFRNLRALDSVGLTSTANSTSGLEDYTLTTIGFKYYEFLTGKNPLNTTRAITKRGN